MNDRPVRVRIGPSPTGEPHVGTGYIALFNLAFAHSQGGKFVLRVEDTDAVRSKPEWEQQIMEGLQWLGLQWDEGPDVGGPFGPYRQSERKEIHHQHAELLVEKGHAYRCFCTSERLTELRESQKKAKTQLGYDGHCRDLDSAAIKRNQDSETAFVIRMKMPRDGQTIVKDRLRGEVAFDNAGVDDQVLLKSDGFPTYHLANVVDDHLMEISHVIRAEEWISSTPKHVVLYDMFGWDAPEFIHMPLLRNTDNTKISKRKNPVSIMDYRQRGFTPEVVLNYLGMLGYTFPGGQEVFGLEEFVLSFSIDNIRLGAPVFDLEKLKWLSGKYLRERMSEDQMLTLIKTEVFGDEYLQQIIPLIRERIDVAEEFIPATEFFFRGDLEYDTALLFSKKCQLTPKALRLALEAFVEMIDAQIDFSAPALSEIGRSFLEQHKLQKGEFFWALRVALTGRKGSPELFPVMSVLGRALSRRRIRFAANALKSYRPASDNKSGPSGGGGQDGKKKEKKKRDKGPRGPQPADWLTPEEAEALKKMGIETNDQILEKLATEDSRMAISGLGIQPERLEAIAKAADLVRILKLSADQVHLLTAADRLSASSWAAAAEGDVKAAAAQIAAALEESDAEHNIGANVPKAGQIIGWINRAKAMPGKVS